MYTRREDGTLHLIPADHEKVLEQYRDSMPMVWEPQSCGDSFPLYPLIDVDAEPDDAEEPTQLERLAKRMAGRLQLLRLGKPGAGPEYKALATEAAREYLADLYSLAMYVHFDERGSREAFRDASEKDLMAAAQKLSRTVAKIAREIIADQPAGEVFDRISGTLAEARL